MAIGGAYRSSTDLITEALANLGVLAAGQSPDPEDWNYVAEKIDSIIRMLVGLEICYVADQNNIPGVYFSFLADIVAGECSLKFGSDPDTYARLTQKGLGNPPGTGSAAMGLKAITRGRYTGEVLRTEYL
jgi:hypothetical protein